MLSKRLAQARHAASLSRDQLAELSGVSAHAIYMYERGEQIPRADALFRIAQALGKPMDYFFGVDDEDHAAEIRRLLLEVNAQLAALAPSPRTAEAAGKLESVLGEDLLTELADELVDLPADSAREMVRTWLEQLRVLKSTKLGE